MVLLFLGSVLPLYTTMFVRVLSVRSTKKQSLVSKPLLRTVSHQFLQYKCTQDSLPVQQYNWTKQCVYATTGWSKVCSNCLLLQFLCVQNKIPKYLKVLRKPAKICWPFAAYAGSYLLLGHNILCCLVICTLYLEVGVFKVFQIFVKTCNFVFEELKVWLLVSSASKCK